MAGCQLTGRLMLRRTSLLVHQIRCSSELKAAFASKFPKHKEKIIAFRKAHGGDKVGEVTVNMIYGGMRGIKGLICETSVVDQMKGVTFRGYTIPECRKLLPKIDKGQEPLPEGVFWLMLTGEMPNSTQVKNLSKEWADRGTLSKEMTSLVNSFPRDMHPMTQFSAAITAMNTDSEFVKAYTKGVDKTKYWEYIYEDVMNLLGKLITLAAMIYINAYKGGKGTYKIDPSKDWSANFCQMLGYDNADFTELMRMYLTIHSDHEGGNVSAHTVHLVGSALSDPYLSFSAGINGLAGPLHGLANQEVLIWLNKLHKEMGDKMTDDALKSFVWKTLKSGQVIPGYGHAVLRATDPRYTCLKEFCESHLPDDPVFKLVSALYKVVPPILKELGKVQNPWPNVDAHSGVVLYYYGMTEMNYYTVLFGVSRALGTLSMLIWSRALGFPIERPKSMDTNDLMKLVAGKK